MLIDWIRDLLNMISHIILFLLNKFRRQVLVVLFVNVHHLQSEISIFSEIFFLTNFPNGCEVSYSFKNKLPLLSSEFSILSKGV